MSAYFPKNPFLRFLKSKIKKWIICAICKFVYAHPEYAARQQDNHKPAADSVVNPLRKLCGTKSADQKQGAIFLDIATELVCADQYRLQMYASQLLQINKQLGKI